MYSDRHRWESYSKKILMLYEDVQLNFGLVVQVKRLEFSVIVLSLLPITNRISILLELALVFVGPFHLLNTCRYLVLSQVAETNS